MVKAPMRMVVIDDDPHFIALAKEIISQIVEVKLTKATTDVKKGIDYLLYYGADILLLDYDMPQLNAFDLLQQVALLVDPADLSVRPMHVILCSGYDIKASELGRNKITEVLEKPLHYTDLMGAINRIKRSLARIPTFNELQGGRQYMLLDEKETGKTIMLHFKDIVYIEEDDTMARFYMNNGKAYEYKVSLVQLKEHLPKAYCIQISRSKIISVLYFDYRKGNSVVLKHYPQENLELGAKAAYPGFFCWFDENYGL
ncbi:LytR/AlgR family response regulator transcription factor [Sphingobacterium sp. LRF_L2]|uniref:LytR/AlgR family response regulator transcription factor n=1 Tax=Sphingobacterium sp. LRF_L2 TaxID=3369421 RepID=UPI003F61D46E